jgi:RimJ/RimL family protein N-acetyltransferase
VRRLGRPPLGRVVGGASGAVGATVICARPRLSRDPSTGWRSTLDLRKSIRTKRLELRPFSLSDGPAVLAYSRDSDWAEFQQTTPTSDREAERVVAEMLLRDWGNQPAWAITRSGEVVGLVSLVFTAEHRIALLGYGIHTDHRGLGLTGEAIRAVLTEAFAVHPQLTRVAANTEHEITAPAVCSRSSASPMKEPFDRVG